MDIESYKRKVIDELNQIKEMASNFSSDDIILIGCSRKNENAY